MPVTSGGCPLLRPPALFDYKLDGLPMPPASDGPASRGRRVAPGTIADAFASLEVRSGPTAEDPAGPVGLGVVPGVDAVLEEAGVRPHVRRPVRDAGVRAAGGDGAHPAVEPLRPRRDDHRVAADLDVGQHEHDRGPGRQAADGGSPGRGAGSQGRGWSRARRSSPAGWPCWARKASSRAASSVGRRAGSASTVSSGRSRASSSLPRQLTESPTISTAAASRASAAPSLPGRATSAASGRAVRGGLPGQRRDPGRGQALVVAALGLGQGHVDARRAGALRCVADGRQRAVGLGGAVVDRRDPPAVQGPALPHVDRGGEPEALRLPHQGARLRAADLAPRHRALDAPVARAARGPSRYARPSRAHSPARRLRSYVAARLSATAVAVPGARLDTGSETSAATTVTSASTSTARRRRRAW